MTAKAGLIPVAVLSLVALAATGFGAGSGRAEDTCLATPNAPAPPGAHWYYRTDRATQRKCWYTRTQDQANQSISAPQQSDAPVAASGATGPEPTAAPKPAVPDVQAHPPRSASDAAGGSLTLRQSQQRPRAGGQTIGATATWTDPVAPTSTMAWPDPPPLPQASDDASTSQTLPPPADAAVQGTTPGGAPALKTANPGDESTPAAAEAPQDESNANPATTAVAEPGKLIVTQSKTSVGMIVVAAIGLLLVGMFMRRMVVRAFAPRITVQADRGEPVLADSVAGNENAPEVPAQTRDALSGRASTDYQIDEIEEALRKLGQRMRQPRVTPFKTIAPFFTGETAVRSRP